MSVLIVGVDRRFKLKGRTNDNECYSEICKGIVLRIEWNNFNNTPIFDDPCPRKSDHSNPTNKVGLEYTKGYNLNPETPSTTLVLPSRKYLPNHGREVTNHSRTRLKWVLDQRSFTYRGEKRENKAESDTLHGRGVAKDGTNLRRTPGVVFFYDRGTKDISTSMYSVWFWSKETFNGSKSIKKYHCLFDCLLTES